MNDIEVIEIAVATLEEYRQDDDNGNYDIFDLAIQALQEKAERENPKPLTLEQLKERAGKPVWVKLTNNRTYYIDKITENFETWCFVECKSQCFKIRTPQSNLLERYEEGYGTTWIAYDHEPKEATNDR